jgi:putative PIN family toxin of toxin-antitoxin system
MKIVLDTNVLVSALLSPFGKPASVLASILSGGIEICLDERIFAEYREVLNRPEFRFPKPQIEALLDFFEREGFFVLSPPLSILLPDSDDIPFLEVAVEASADALVTGNKRHYPTALCHGISVLSPDEFLKQLIAP